MASEDVFAPVEWEDDSTATALTAGRGPNRWEDAIDRLDDIQQEQAAAIDALRAALSSGGGGGGGLVPRGPTADRPPALAGQLYIDTDLDADGVLIHGTGTGWAKYDGTALTAAGGSNAPQNFAGVVQPDNSIVLTWTAVPSATSYKLYEDRSPSGVSGATALTGTTTTRTPSTMGSYRYWLTATVGGVESAISEYAVVSLPYSSTPGEGGGGSVPGDSADSIFEALNFGPTGGYWNLGIGRPSGHVDITWSQLQGGFSEFPYAYLTDAGWVHLQVPMNGAKTSTNTKYPRVEFRELESNGTTKKTFRAGTGTHILQAKQKVVHFAPNKQEVCLLQMHDAGDDMIQVRQHGNGDVIAKFRGDEDVQTLTNIAVGTAFTAKIELINGVCKIYINGVLEYTTNTFVGDNTDDQYWKFGAYAQQNTANGNASSEYCAIEIEPGSVICSHTGE